MIAKMVDALSIRCGTAAIVHHVSEEYNDIGVLFHGGMPVLAQVEVDDESRQVGRQGAALWIRIPVYDLRVCYEKNAGWPRVNVRRVLLANLLGVQ